MSVGMPELKSWQGWRVTMDGDEVEVGIYHVSAVPDVLSGGRVFMKRIRFGTLDSRDYDSEEKLITAIEQKAWEICIIQAEREERQEWIRKNFS